MAEITLPATAPVIPAAPRFFFPRSQRVRDRRDFQRIQGKGTRLGGKLLLLLALKQPGKPVPARLGITASRKSGPSVERSRIKRLVREVFRLNPLAFPVGYDFVVIARQGAALLTLKQTQEELLRAAVKLRGSRTQAGPAPQR